MSNASKNRKQSAKERIAAQQAAARRAEARRRRFIAGGSIVVVAASVLAIILIKVSDRSPGISTTGSSASSTTGKALPASVAKNVTSVPLSTLSAVGKGSVLSYNPTPITAVSDTPLTSNGKPEMLYIGAEFCPYCAAMRWSMAVALSRFGSLTPLHGIYSSGSDTFPNTATLTFYKSGYTSKYLTFTAVENEKVNHDPLQNVTSAQQAIWQKYDANSYPFIDFGNKFVIKAPIYNPQVLAGKTWAQIAAALQDPSSPIAQGANGAANYITAAICQMTNNQPANVCTTTPISSLEGHL
jgi:thiol-disulfide isomerase/thioredoxin